MNDRRSILVFAAGIILILLLALRWLVPPASPFQFTTSATTKTNKTTNRNEANHPAEFAKFNGTARKSITRLNSSGGLDTGFNPGAGATIGTAQAIVRSIALVSNGSLYIGGNFTVVDGVPRVGIARFASNGALETSFNPGLGAPDVNAQNGGGVNAIFLQADGKVIVAGSFVTLTGTQTGIPRLRIGRLLDNGDIDLLFRAAPSAQTATHCALNGAITSLAVSPSGLILLGGAFTQFKSYGLPEGEWTRNRLARIQSFN
jgi:hypothetical protein